MQSGLRQRRGALLLFQTQILYVNSSTYACNDILSAMPLSSLLTNTCLILGNGINSSNRHHDGKDLVLG